MGFQKILIVDDEAGIVNIVKLRLEANDYCVVTAYDGEEALEKTSQEMPDLIVLDLMLPKMDGYMICSLLKKNARYAAIPIILFSARSTEADKALGMKVGADAYITKPVDMDVLLAKIEELLAKKADA